MVQQTKTVGIWQQVVKPFLVLSVLLGIAALLQMKEVAWLLLLLWVPFYCTFYWRWWLGCCLLPLSIATLNMHFQGHKLVGIYTVEENRPFEPSGYIAAFGPGPTLSLTDGRTIRLSGLSAMKDEQGKDALDDRWQIAGVTGVQQQAAYNEVIARTKTNSSQPRTWMMVSVHLELWKTAEGVPVKVIDQGDGTFRVLVALGRPRVECGNSLSEEFFPPRYPMYTSRDLAEILLDRHYVVADGSATDPVYRQALASYRPKRK